MVVIFDFNRMSRERNILTISEFNLPSEEDYLNFSQSEYITGSGSHVDFKISNQNVNFG
jgi:hypothetical protein